MPLSNVSQHWGDTKQNFIAQALRLAAEEYQKIVTLCEREAAQGIAGSARTAACFSEQARTASAYADEIERAQEIVEYM